MKDEKDLASVSFEGFECAEDPSKIKDRLEKITAYGSQLCQLEVEVSDLDERMKEKQREIKNIGTEILPELLIEAGLESFVLSNGKTIKLTDNIETSFIKEVKPAALQWLEDNKYGGMIKSTIVVSYAREEKAMANKLMKQLQARKTVVSADIKQEADVHPQTLKAFGRTLYADGEGSTLPGNLFNTHRVRIAKVK